MTLGAAEFQLQGPAGPKLKGGTVDPSAAGGVPAPLGSIYQRTLAGSVQLWQKVDAADTAWSMIAVVGVVLTVFRYTVTGLEADLTDFFIPLPVARATDTYRVTASLAGVTNIIPFDLPDTVGTDRTTAHFRIVSGSAFTAGDKIDIFIANDQ